jgi:hypothetical protein
MGTESGWTEKAKEDWAKYRTEFEAYVPDVDTVTPQGIGQLRKERQRFIDFVEKNYAGLPDLELLEIARGCWGTIHWIACYDPQEVHHLFAIKAALSSRGYDVEELYDKWYVEAVAKVKATVDAMVLEGEPLGGLVRAIVADATDKVSGEVDWSMIDLNLVSVCDEGNGIDDATLARHGFQRSMDYWARKEVATVIASRDGFVAARVIRIAATTIHTLNGGPAVRWIDALRELRALGYWDNVQGLKNSEFERQRALAESLGEATRGQ